MADVTIVKGCVVEVSSDEPGFHGAWYMATVEDVIDPSSSMLKASSTKKKKKKNSTKNGGYLVKYDTLFKEDKMDEHLTEVVDASYVRPLPPRYPRRREDDNVADEGDSDGGLEFEVDDVIDAFHRDGWWTGVVKRKMGDNMGFIVGFENPPEEFEFKASQLRFHVDWVDHHWVFPSKNKELGDKNGTQTSESNTNTNTATTDGFTTPSKGPNEPVAARLASLRMTSARKKPEANPETRGSVSNTRKKRSFSFDSSDKRPQSSAGVQSSAVSKRNKKSVVAGTETSGSEAVQQDLPLVEQETAITATSDTQEGNCPQKKKKERPQKLQFKQPNGLQQDNQEACKGSSVFDETTDFDEQPLSTWVQGLHPLSLLKRRSCCSPPDQHGESSVALNQTMVNTYQQDWPFTKRSPLWDTIGALEVFKTPVQKPHFSPLKKVNKVNREGLAIGFMVTFANMAEVMSKIQLSDPLDINENFETLSDLEAHGFNVGFIRTRLNEFVTWKVRVYQLKDKLKKVENEFEKHNLEKSTIEKEMSQLAVKMVELKEQMVQAETAKNLKDEELKRLQSDLDLFSKEIKNWALAFDRLAATPL